MGTKDYQMCVTGGHRGLGISAASVLVFAAPACTAGTWGRLPDLLNVEVRLEERCVSCS